MLQDILCNKEQITKLENEKLKIEEKVDSLERECNKIEKDSNSRNEDLLKVIKNEKENLKKLQIDFDIRISK